MVERNVLRWKALQPYSPTIESYETYSKEHRQENYVTNEKSLALDDIVNGIGNGTLKVGSDEWYALQKKGDKLQEQIDAYNRGMMGVLDGEKAVMRSKQETTGTTKSGGGQMGDMSLSENNDAPMYAGLDDEEQQSVFDFDNTISEEERLRQEIEVTFASLQNMSDKEQTEFMMSGEGKKHQQDLNELRNLIGILRFTDYTKELYGEGIDNTQSYSSLEYLDSIKDDRGHATPNNTVNTVKDKIDYLKEQISGFYIEANNMSSVEIKEKYPNGIGNITAMEFELQDLIGNKSYQEFMDELVGYKATYINMDQNGNLFIDNREFPQLTNFDTLDEMEVINSFTITKQEFDTAGFLLSIPEYLSDSPGILGIAETIVNFAEGANNSLDGSSIRVDIVNDDGVEKVVYALEIKDNPLTRFYNEKAQWTKIDDEGTHLYTYSNWYDWKDFYFDKGHVTDNTLAYFYVENGILMCQINILPNDRFFISEEAGPYGYEDITDLYSHPFEFGHQE